MSNEHVPFKQNRPRRTCTRTYRSYGSYLRFLKRDFNFRCGYCGEFQIDGYSFHIDHFAPKSKFPELETAYSNLVYSCPICNMGKGDDWVTISSDSPNNGTEGYIDPCDKSYNNQFTRNSLGCIVPSTPLGRYMHKKFKFRLRRRRILWRMRRIKELIDQVNALIEGDISENEEKILLRQYRELAEAFIADTSSLFIRCPR